MKYFEKIQASLEDRYKNKSILILGFGQEGISTYHLLEKLNTTLKIYIMDQNAVAVKNYLEQQKDPFATIIPPEDYLKGLDGFDVIFKTPGLPGYLLKQVDISKITSQSELFMEFLGDRCIGVTGTKGKSTTSSLLAYILEKGGVKTKLVGNIGYPALESLLEDDGEIMYVYEMSSFQTEFLQVGPSIGIILNLFEEHLNNYEGYDNYQESKLQLFKAKITNPQDQVLIYGCDNHVLLNKINALREIYDDRNYFTFGYSLKNSMSDPGYFIEDDNIVRLDNDHLAVISDIHFPRKLLGDHNLLNSLVAFIVVDKLTKDGKLNMSSAEVVRLIGEFKGLPHRLEDVGEFNGIRFYNDSISTIPEATIKAIESIDSLGTLIIGGFDRKINYQSFADYLDEMQELNIICLPSTGHKVFDLMSHTANCYKVADMDEAVTIAFQKTPVNNGCLLSPAASSYNQYKNFEERGDHFVECIRRGASLEE